MYPRTCTNPGSGGPSNPLSFPYNGITVSGTPSPFTFNCYPSGPNTSGRIAPSNACFSELHSPTSYYYYGTQGAGQGGYVYLASPYPNPTNFAYSYYNRAIQCSIYNDYPQSLSNLAGYGAPNFCGGPSYITLSTVRACDIKPFGQKPIAASY